ncbi:MAG: DUF2190 family protein, partial [Deltaproteobacteria bacterium]|nr:DUF2190 family protein [Deltaproteobacteria bacterium]
LIRPGLANGALAAKRHVKLSAGTVTNPAQVEYAGAGENGIGITQYAAADGEPVAVKLWGDGGTHEVTASKAIAEGATVYAAASGKVSDAAVGTALGVALEVGAADSIMEMVKSPYIATTAATVSVADAGNLIDGATVEAALAEIMQGIKTAQYAIQPLGITLETGAPTVVFADGAADGFTQLTNKEVGLRWNNGANPTKMAARFLIPPDLDPAADILVHFLGAIVKAGADEADSPTITAEAYFAAAGAAMLADADCGGVSGEFVTAQDDKYQEKTLTIDAADIPAAASILTLVFNPTDGELPADDFVLAGLWLEVTRKCLTS